MHSGEWVVCAPMVDPVAWLRTANNDNNVWIVNNDGNANNNWYNNDNIGLRPDLFRPAARGSGR